MTEDAATDPCAPDRRTVSREERLAGENARLREQLEEAQETLDAIRNGEVDAVVVAGADNVPRIYTLETADRSYRLLVEEMQEGALTLTASGEILYCNPRFARLVDENPGHIIGGSLQRFVAHPEWPQLLALMAEHSKGEMRLRAQDGRLVPTHLSFNALRGGDSDVDQLYCCIVTDLTEQRRAGDALRATHESLLTQVAERERTEALLRQSQKMEAVGQLTGGVAHDFNNLLMVISGGVHLLARDVAPERRKRVLDGMRQAADRGAALTRQLLAFSRKKELHPVPIDLQDHINGLRELFDRSLRGDINVKTQLDSDVWPVCVDAGEFGTALLNLCVNARDAMPQGGLITITASNQLDIDREGLQGDFVRLSVADTGQGMTPETMARCMEPFFTTKDIGKGSGLGLAQVYGFARGSQGIVTIESVLDQGTRVTLFLPRSREFPAVTEARAVDHKAAATQLGHVLLVEDDVAVADLTCEMLAELGYKVLHVTDARAGLNAIGNTAPIDLVVSDVMMPGGMDGISFAKEVRRRRSGLAIVLVSGYAEAARQEADAAAIPLLSKPYTLEDLSNVLREARTQKIAAAY